MSSPRSGVLRRLRSTAATTAATLATTASRLIGHGAGGMIGGLVANAIDPSIMENLGRGRPAVLVTGTNGKSTTTRMLAAAVRTKHTVATNDGGDNMDAGIISALLAGKDASHIVLEVDELHVPSVVERLRPQALVLLNLTRDQLDRVGEINKIERALRGAVMANPEMLVIANCDDVLMTSVAYDAPNVVWVSAGAGWIGDSVSCPRTGGHVVREVDDWWAFKPLPDGRTFRRPTPTWTITDDGLSSPHGDSTLDLKLPGRANRGNATQAIAAAVEGCDVPLADAVAAAESVDNVAGRYSTNHPFQMKLKGVRGQGKLGKSPPASTKLGSTRRAGPESLGYPGDHDVESSAVQTSGGQGSEVVVVLDREMCEELLGEVGVVIAEEEVVFSVEEDHVLFDSAELP